MFDPEVDALSQAKVDGLIDLALRYKKLPSENWNTFKLAVDSGISQSIYEQSHQAWLVYASAHAQVNRAQKFELKENYRRTLDAVNSSNVEAFVDLLDQRIRMRDEEARNKVNKLLEEAETARKRRRIVSASEDEETYENDNRDKDTTRHRLTPETSTRPVQETNTGTNEELQWHLFSNASLDATVSLFPQFLADAIERTCDPSRTDIMVAAVQMHTPSKSGLYSQGCVMAIHIIGGVIFRLARDLFDVYVEQDVAGLYVSCTGGAKIRPKPSLVLDGCRIDAISTVFGDQIYQAIKSNDAFQEQLRRRHSTTAAVTLTIDTQEVVRGTLLLCLGVMEGGTIRSQLYI